MDDHLFKLDPTYDDETCVSLLLDLEMVCEKPNEKRKKHFLKKKLPNIPFTTPAWQTWVSERSIDFLV